ncbi:MAG TPA: di-heme oxidoredictase family protein [Terriglobales bacterium]|nr:di-heme oxidoredictase family protein [Terriglobales bacterium]
MKNRNTVSVCLWYVLLTLPLTAWAQRDPGPRPGPAAAGGTFPTITSNAQEVAFFNQSLARFQAIDSVSGKIEPGSGLGPTYNGNSCVMCHSQPAPGGSSPGLASPQNPVPNPQVAVANVDGATNTVPTFITRNGPVREARFIINSNGSLDGGVHGLYTIAGRTDASGCTLAQPPFSQQLSAGNVIFRIPTPTFGLGLVESTPDATLQANLASTAGARFRLRVGGAFNTSGNDGSITRFGWKAQNKSLLMFAGEAYNVEIGTSNEVFPNERSAVPGCVYNAAPEDASNMLNGNGGSPNFGTNIGTISEMSSDIVNFAAFSRMLAPPTPAPSTTSTQNGARLFSAVGCALCHSPSLISGGSVYTGPSQTYHPYSDFALHHMGPNLADGIDQGVAGPDEFRTAPLWGVGQRLFFLHDGRTSDLMRAIFAHAGSGNDCRGQHFTRLSQGNCGSEANQVIQNFQSLSPSQMQDVLNFLRSL